MIIILNDIRNSRRNDALIFVFILSDHVFTCIIIFISDIEFQYWNYDQIRYQSEIFHTLRIEMNFISASIDDAYVSEIFYLYIKIDDDTIHL